MTASSDSLPVVRQPRLPITTMVKQLRLKMARMQSPRIQCCCCAVGVFAAMFGIFMLSAGICIVLNVTIMEVDTSGLPPGLHNENGKKVVGIILICVAIVFLGLSGTVSILYFTMCNRKAQATSTPAASIQHGHPKPHAQGIAHGQERPKSRESMSSGKFRLTPSYTPEGGMYSRAQVTSRSDYSKSKAYRGRKSALSRSVLPPHEEEDVEAARSALEMNMPGSATIVRRLSQSQILEHSATKEELPGSSDVIDRFSSKINPPTIVIGYFPQDDVTDHVMETQLNDSILEEDSISNAFSEQLEGAGLYQPYYGVQTSFSDKFLMRTTNKCKDLEDSELEPPPDLPHNVDVLTDFPDSAHASVSFPDQTSGHHNLLKVTLAERHDLDSCASSCTSLKEMADEEADDLPDLPYGQQEEQCIELCHCDQDSRIESRSSFNSAFSCDGDEQAQADMDRLRTRMDLLIERDVSK